MSQSTRQHGQDSGERQPRRSTRERPAEAQRLVHTIPRLGRLCPLRSSSGALRGGGSGCRSATATRPDPSSIVELSWLSLARDEQIGLSHVAVRLGLET